MERTLTVEEAKQLWQLLSRMSSGVDELMAGEWADLVGSLHAVERLYPDAAPFVSTFAKAYDSVIGGLMDEGF